jgi:hypothetical protein
MNGIFIPRGYATVGCDEQEQDDLDAVYAQYENEERAQWEARIKERSRQVTAKFHASNAEFARDCERFRQSLNTNWTLL